MSEAFDRAVAYVLEQEGGFSDDPEDPGRATNHGISSPTLKRAIFLGLVPTETTARTLTQKQAIEIYRSLYWDVIKGDLLREPVAFALFDAATNQGTDAAIKLLQKALGVTADGIIGPKTILESHVQDQGARLLDELTTNRLLRYMGTPNVERYGHGWFRRAVGTHRRGLALLWKVA